MYREGKNILLYIFIYEKIYIYICMCCGSGGGGGGGRDNGNAGIFSRLPLSSRALLRTNEYPPRSPQRI